MWQWFTRRLHVLNVCLIDNAAHRTEAVAVQTAAVIVALHPTVSTRDGMHATVSAPHNISFQPHNSLDQYVPAIVRRAGSLRPIRSNTLSKKQSYTMDPDGYSNILWKDSQPPPLLPNRCLLSYIPQSDNLPTLQRPLVEAPLLGDNIIGPV